MTSNENALTCAEVLSKLMIYLDSEIDDETEANIERHLDDCRECFSRAEFEKRLRQKVASTASVTPPDDVQKRLRALMQKF